MPGLAGRLISLALALYVLNFSLSFHNVWPTLAVTTRHELSIEIALLVLALALYIRFMRPVTSRALTALALGLTALTLARYFEVTAPALFGRRINLYWDARYVPHVAEMLAETAGPLLTGLAAAGILLAIAGVFLALRLSLSRVATGAGRPYEGRATIAIAVLVIAGYGVGYAGLPPLESPRYSLPITRTYWQQASFIADVVAGEAEDVLPAESPLGGAPLPRLAGRDVIVQFVESYGAIAFDVPAINNALAGSREDLEETIAATGRRVVSAYIKSPTFGGNSWLSHASFMTGLKVDRLSSYELLLTQDRPTLATLFGAIGYQAVALMPGLRSEWPEGAFYGFGKIYGADELDYRGPGFGWWRIPDQYSLARLAEKELQRPRGEPLFLFFTAISSHMPFRPTPPYQPDWARLLGDHPFGEPLLGEALALGPDWTDMRPAYAGTIDYTYRYIGGFLHAQAGRDFVWVIIGDHQPPANVSGPDARWEVPVHVITADAAILEPLLGQGFVEGLTPAQTVGSMHELPVTLLSAFQE